MPTFHARRLPHLHVIGQPIFLTWRLHGSLPANRVFPHQTTKGRAFLAMDNLLDAAGTGPRHLCLPEIASLVVEAIRYRDQGLRHYQLHAYVVMSNHVHLLVTPQVEVTKIMHSLKRLTAREANLVLGLTGQPFWQDESYDSIVRDDTHFQRVVNYVEMNPVHVGLVARPEDFRWSSAWPISNRRRVVNAPNSRG